MTPSETSKIMNLIKVAYPRYYIDASETDMKNAVIVWTQMLKDYDAELVKSAVIALISTAKFPPAISEVIEKIQYITQPKEMTEIEAWALVSKALKNSTYGSQSEYERLPELLQKILGSPSTLKEWAMCDVEDVQTVIQSNFMRSYKAKVKGAKEYLALPNEIKALVSGIAERMALTSGEEAEAW